MAKRRYYTVQHQWEYGWMNYLSATHVPHSEAKGFINGIRQYYPCPNLRIIDAETLEVVENFSGNGEVHTN